MKPKKQLACCLGLALAIALPAAIGSSYAIADTNNLDTNIIDNASPLEDANAFKEDEGKLVSEDENQIITIKEGDEGTECSFLDTSETGVAASFEIEKFENKSNYATAKVELKAKDENLDSSAIVENADGTIRTSFIANSSNSPEKYAIDFNLPDKTHLEFSKDLEGNVDGSIEASDEDGNILFAIGIPWATDANGNKVTTFYRIKGNRLIQVVKHKSEDVSHPIVADPSIKFSGWFKSGSWGTTKAKSGTGAWSGTKKISYLHLVPTDSFKISCVTSLSNGEIANSFRSASWSLVKNKFKSSKKWKNEKSLKTQYYCHTNLLAAKGLKYGSWDINIEPARPNVSLVTCAKYGCNP